MQDIPKRPLHAPLAGLIATLITAGLPALGYAHTGNLPPSLKDVKVPDIPGLLDGSKPIVMNQSKAIALGKALFWDMNVGSDGMACGSCHFHAGADTRSKNQLSPGKAHLPGKFSDSNAYDPKDPRGPNLANWQLTKRDFPLYKFDPQTGKLIEDSYTYNAVASSGTFAGDFVGVAKTTPASTGAAKDECKAYTASGAGLDQTYHVGNLHTRRVEPRNAPTFINAVLFDRQFWDGRANHAFNGVSVWGPRDPDAYLWVLDGGAVWKTRMALENASLASLAVGPPLNEFEMSCKGRTWPDIGRKLLKRRALEAQEVHAEDSVLSPLRNASGKGLSVTYEQLVKDAFDSRLWAAGTHPSFGKPRYDKTGFSQAEANFSFFFGLAIQMYGATLISDDTPYDRANLALQDGKFVDRNNVLTPQQVQGFQDFNDAHCIFCHTGPLFSTATHRVTRYKDGDSAQRTMVNRIATQDGSYRLADTGFLNNGAVPSVADPGLNNVDDYGKPLAFAPQYLAGLAGRSASVSEPLPLIQACNIGFNGQGNFSVSEFGAGNVLADPAGSSGCADPASAVVPKPDLVAAALDRGAAEQRLGPPGAQFKTPQLYNVELTGPYMHNGGMSSLDQVLDQYLVQVGNFTPGNSVNHVNPDMHKGLIFQAAINRDNLAAFLLALTDERVRYEREPFDHPQVLVPNGHPGNEQQTQGSGTDAGLARDDILVVPAVGKNGRTTPLETFHDLLPD
ncbi:cytochrome c peroxidase [Methylomagnum sp.]